ncbi:dipeptide/oligopeptide/nickel ABC transporter ATP-binding protein [Flexivirga endophytica]|uniref:Dipeptide/oligopeptide/nickel ABC transporter ATP-binding protein n=1 Tax=Flexivirga endophytica TaxID=1849103 RepID=A0A916SZK7_9MICO|nr:dipeptide/oligopeptide/nickel ABC transporter permease/ATP-binding protein [Flexivirga endophytica]GGB24568.1 dipeptide/oligopeptide/nickel ABC transporter ATP-binding protein [Flexivirga endophytica]GHB63275.1 dipeptide/oligopeptide/nickel ABC transporter ATP-binding protein [Flexivirga endophytica]
MTAGVDTTQTHDGPAAPADPARQSIVRSLLRTPRGLLTVGFLVVLFVASLLAPVVAPHDPLHQELKHALEGPSGQYWLGTDGLGRDVLSRLLYGGRSSLLGVLEGVVAHVIVAVPLGIAAGYLGGWTDRIITRVVDIVMSVPTIVILLALLTMFDRNISAAMITLGALSAAGTTRMIRAAALSVRGELFVSAAELLGLSRPQILFRHILPRCRGVIIVQVSLFAAVALGIQTGLTYLSLGPPPPAPTWGGMVADAASSVSNDPWLLVPAGGLIGITVLCFGILGDTVRDITAQSSTASAGLRAPRRRPEPATGAPEEGALLSVRELSVTFRTPSGDRDVLTSVSFDVQPGETLGLVGESGSGKTVTARAVLGLLENNGAVAHGSARFDGVDLLALPRKRWAALRGKRIALISQEPMVALDPSFTVGAQLREVVRAHDHSGRAEAHERVLELLRLVELPDPEEIVKQYPFQISGGMAQRVAIALALAGRPDLLVADEPTTALDVTVQAEILDLLRRLQQETGMAIVLVTHDWGVVADSCSRVAVMYAGQVVERADVEDVFRHPSHPYTRALMATSPEHAERGRPIAAIAGQVPAPGTWPTGCRFAARCPLMTEACRREPVAMVDLGEGRDSRCLMATSILEGTSA